VVTVRTLPIRRLKDALEALVARITAAPLHWQWAATLHSGDAEPPHETALDVDLFYARPRTALHRALSDALGLLCLSVRVASAALIAAPFTRPLARNAPCSGNLLLLLRSARLKIAAARRRRRWQLGGHVRICYDWAVAGKCARSRRVPLKYSEIWVK